MDADKPHEGPGEEPRKEMDDAPPFLSWRAIYIIVLGALAAEITAGIALTLLHR